MSLLDTKNVFLFVPNLIGYARVLLAAVAMCCLDACPRTAVALYSVSALLDAADGTAARKLNQCSKLGAVLDMVTDRTTTACLHVYLACAYPSLSLVFYFLISLDIAAHYMQMYASLTTGAASHKAATHNNRLLNAYYTNSRVLFLVCAGDQLCFILLFLLNAASNPSNGFSNSSVLAFYFLLAVTGPVCLLKQFLNVIQLVGSAQALALIDVQAREKGKGKAQ